MILKIKGEDGKTVEDVRTDVAYLISFTRFLYDLDDKFKEKLPLIYHIDLYTDTYINQTQAPLYIEEFKKLSEYTEDDNLKKFCDLVINELNNLELGDFLVFFGD